MPCRMVPKLKDIQRGHSWTHWNGDEDMTRKYSLIDLIFYNNDLTVCDSKFKKIVLKIVFIFW